MSLTPCYAAFRRTMAMALLRRSAGRCTLVQAARHLSSCPHMCNNASLMQPKYGSIGHRNCANVRNVCLSHKRCHSTIPVFLRAEEFNNRTAVISQHGRYTYEDLLQYSANFAREITDHVVDFQKTVALGVKVNKKEKQLKFPLAGKRVAFLCDHDMSYTVAQWATWLCGAIAVPLSKAHPTIDLEYFVEDSGASLIVCSEDFKDRLVPVSQKLGVPIKVMYVDSYGGEIDDDAGSAWDSPEGFKSHLTKELQNDSFKEKNAMIVYTSGTTNRPKGVVHTFGNLDAMMQDMISTWAWTRDDVILHVLPLHHVHGIVNKLMTPLYCGATCVMLPKYEPKQIWQKLVSNSPQINVFMAVPTVYAKLIEEYEEQAHSSKPYIPDDIANILKRNVRLMVSGSAALPQPIMENWEKITGHVLLERYGMTEIGMALTNPLNGHRTPGAVGLPFPGVTARIVELHEEDGSYKTLVNANQHGVKVTPGTEGESGELMIKGDNVFHEYWNKPKATLESFTHDGWFKTGDTAVYADGVFRIVGRTSVDVIKSGGYKISALYIERHLLSHPDIRDVAVMGLPDITWGQLVSAVVVTKSGSTLTLDDLQNWVKDKMATYQWPRVLKCLNYMPRNSMGKVNKKLLAKEVFPEYFNGTDK